MHTFPMILKRDNIFLTILGALGETKDPLRVYTKNDPYIDANDNIVLYKKYKMLDLQLAFEIDGEIYLPGSFTWVSGGKLECQLHKNPLNVSHFSEYTQSDIEDIPITNINNVLSNIRQALLSDQPPDRELFAYNADDDAFSKIIKQVILTKNLSMKYLKDREEITYEISNLQFALLHHSVMTTKTFHKWSRILGIVYEVEFTNGDISCISRSDTPYISKIGEIETNHSNGVYKPTDIFRFVIDDLVNIDTIDTFENSKNLNMKKKILNVLRQSSPISLKYMIWICDYTKFHFFIRIFDQTTHDLLLQYSSLENITA